jgi:hypothetical protein
VVAVADALLGELAAYVAYRAPAAHSSVLARSCVSLKSGTCVPTWQFDSFWATLLGGFIVFGVWSASLKRRTARLAAEVGVERTDMVLQIRRCRRPSRATVAGHAWRYLIFSAVVSVIAGSIDRSAPFGAWILWLLLATGITINGVYAEILMRRWKRLHGNPDHPAAAPTRAS